MVDPVLVGKYVRSCVCFGKRAARWYRDNPFIIMPIYVRVWVCVGVWGWVCACACVWVYVRVCVYVCMCVRVCMPPRLGNSVYVSTRQYISDL